MNKTIGDVLFAGLKKLEGVVSSYAPKVWEIMLKQQYVESIGYGLAAIASIAIFIVGLWLNRKNGRISKIRDYDTRGPVRILSIMAMTICVIVFISCSYACIGRLINPAYYVLQNIIHLIS